MRRRVVTINKKKMRFSLLGDYYNYTGVARLPLCLYYPFTRLYIPRKIFTPFTSSIRLWCAIPSHRWKKNIEANK
jgi:hypothetical protein